MKNKNRLLFTSLISVGLATLANTAYADVTKADNATALNLTGAYVGGALPTSSDLFIIDTTLTAPRTSALGDNLSVLGITSSSGQAFTISNTATKALTIGASGISHTGAGTLILASAVTLGANQTWAINNRRFELHNTLTTGGNTLSITGTTGSRLELKNTTLGTDVTIGSVGIVTIDNTTVTINGVNNTNAGFDLYNNATVNIASMGNLGGASSIGAVSATVLGTLNYTGGNFSSDKGFRKQNPGTAALNVTQASTTLSMSGNVTSRLASHTGGFSFGGAGNLSLSGNILNGTSTTVTKNGTGITTLSGTGHTYSSTTTVTSGKLTISGAGNINSTSGVTIGTASTSATSEFNYNSSVALTKAVTFAAGSTGGTLSGNGTINQAVSITTGNTLAIGNSVGQMNFGDTLGLNGTTVMEIDGVAGAGNTGGHDLANVTGAITYGGALTLDLGTIFSTGGYTWNLFDFAGADGGTFSSVSLTGSYSGSLLDGDSNGVWDHTSGNNTWQFTESTGVLGLTVAVPEPNAAALLGGFGVLALLRRRRTA